MLAAFALLALAAPSPAAPAALPVRARVTALVRIVAAVEVRSGQADVPHQRRSARSPEGRRLTLLEFE
jgi:hypothetical protein